MGSSIFSAMTWLKVASMTTASLPFIPSIEMTNREKSLCWSYQSCPFPPSLIFLNEPKNYLLPLNSKYLCQHLQTWRQWLLPSDSPIGPILTHHPVFWDAPSMTPLLLQSAAAQLRYVIYVYKVMVEGLSCEADDLVTYLIVTCADKIYIRADQRVTHKKSLHVTVTLFLGIRGVKFVANT